MSFGVSPSDILKLLELSTKVYFAFKNANDNSEAQVEGLVRELDTFNRSLNDLKELMIEYGRPLPFPYQDFRDTIQKCETCIKSYADNLIDKRMGFTKIVYTFKYMGKEKEIDGLRKQISVHCQSLHLCISSLQLRLQLEAMKQAQRLHIPTQGRAIRSRSLAEPRYTIGSHARTSRTAALALPAPDEADELLKDWQLFSRHFRSEEDRIAREAGLSLGVTSDGVDSVYATESSRDPQTAAFLHHLHREIEDAVIIEENRAKRAAVGGRTHLGPSDAVRQELRDIPPVPRRTFTLESDFSGEFAQFDLHQSVTSSMAAIRPDANTPSPMASPTQPSYFNRRQTSRRSPSVDLGQHSSASSQRSSLNTSPDIRLSLSSDLTTTETTPELTPPRNVRASSSATSLVTIYLGEGALDWKSLCHKVQVERTRSSAPPQSQECDIHWRYNEDAGLAIRSVYRSGSAAKVWATQIFPATGPSIPLTTSYSDGDVSIDFPRPPFSRHDKLHTDIKYTFAKQESANKMQTLLYTNDGKDAAELLFDRCVLTVSSNLNKPECRGKNVRLWSKSEMFNGEMVDVLVFLFYTSALSENQAHWVEEPHYAFQWLTEDVCKKGSDKLTLVFSKEPGKWSKDKLFQRHKSYSASTVTATTMAMTPRRDSGQSLQHPPLSSGIPSLVRMSTHGSIATATSIDSSRSLFAPVGKGRLGSLNRYGYGELEIIFHTRTDRKDFVEIWQKYVKQFGTSSSRS